MEDTELDHVLTTVGPRLKALRREQELTLQQLSERTGISTSTLSRLESGLRKPTLELLLPLARAHSVPLDELVDAPSTGDPRIHPRPVHHGDRTIVPLTRNLGGLRAYKHILPAPKDPVDSTTLLEQRTHEGYEWLYVLSGRLLIALGDQRTVLTAGEAAEFDTRVPHGFINAGPGPLEFLSLFGAQGERVHLRARAMPS